MGNRKKIVASITGVAALVAAPFIQNAFSAAASAPATPDTPATTTSQSTTSTQATTNNETASDTSQPAATADNGEQANMPVSVHTEISNGQASVTVNGQETVVPQGESLHQTISDGTSTTTVNVTSNDGNVSTNTSTSGGRTRINSRTSSSVKVNSSTRDSEVQR